MDFIENQALEVDGEEAQAKVDSLTVARERSVGLINALEGRLSEVKQSSAQEVEQLGSQLKTVQVQAEQLNDDLSELHEKHAATEQSSSFLDQESPTAGLKMRNFSPDS